MSKTGKWYYLTIIKPSNCYDMRIEPEVKLGTTITPPPWEEWCEFA